MSLRRVHHTLDTLPLIKHCFACLVHSLSSSLLTNSVQSLQTRMTLCQTMDCSLPGSSVHGILQEWVAMPSSRGSSLSRDQTRASYISCIGRQVLFHWHHLGNPLHSTDSLNILMIKINEKTDFLSVYLCFGSCVPTSPLLWKSFPTFF